jgi:hypothetical protein
VNGENARTCSISSTEELDPQRLAAVVGKTSTSPAAHGELTAVLGALDALVACKRKRLRQVLDAELRPRAGCGSAPDGRLRPASFGSGGGRDDDEPAAGEDVERTCPLADEVRRRLEAGIPTDAATGRSPRLLRPQKTTPPLPQGRARRRPRERAP